MSNIFAMSGNERDLHDLCMQQIKFESEKIIDIFARKYPGQDVKLNLGFELELATAAVAKPDGTFADLDYDVMNRDLRRLVPALTTVKTEGQAWVFFQHSKPSMIWSLWNQAKVWFENGVANPAHRYFIPDLPADQMLVQTDGATAVSNNPKRLLRREIVIGHDNVSPADAVTQADRMQYQTERYLVQQNGGDVAGSFSPKVLDPEHARELVDVSSVVKWLYQNGHLKGNLKRLLKQITTLEHLEKRGIHFAGMPGNADQANLSVKVVDSQGRVTYPMFDPATGDGNDLAYRMQKGYIEALKRSALALNLTHASYQRLSRQRKDAIGLAADMAEARPAYAVFGKTKFGGSAVKFSPYAAEENALIASMAGQRGASYLEERKPDGSNFRLETRSGDETGLRSLRVLLLLASARQGLEQFEHENAAQIKAELLDHSKPVPFPTSLGHAVGQYVRNADYFRELLGEDISRLVLTVAGENLVKPTVTADVVAFRSAVGLKRAQPEQRVALS